MSRIEVPKTTEGIQDLVDRYGATATIIGTNQVRTDRLNYFADMYAADDAEPLRLPSGLYTQPDITGVTVSGTLVHTRIHEAPHRVDESTRYAMVVDSVFDTSPAAYWTAQSSSGEISYTGVGEIKLTAGQVVGYGPGLRSVEDESDDAESTERSLDIVLSRLALPQVCYGNMGLRMRVAVEDYETLHEIHNVQRDVAALRQELAIAAVRSLAKPHIDELAPTGSDE